MGSTKDKHCSEFCHIEALSNDKGLYETKCNESCAKFSEKYGTCIDYMLKDIQIQQIMKKIY